MKMKDNDNSPLVVESSDAPASKPLTKGLNKKKVHVKRKIKSAAINADPLSTRRLADDDGKEFTGPIVDDGKQLRTFAKHKHRF